MFNLLNDNPNPSRHTADSRMAGLVRTLMFLLLAITVVVGSGLTWTTRAWSAVVCPFCSAVKQTLSEEMLTTDAVVLAKVVGPGKPAPGSEATAMLDLLMELEITQVIKGKNLVSQGKSFTTVVPPTFKAGQECLVMGVVTDQLSWSTPVKMTDRSRAYVMKLPTLPEEGPQRLQFFLDYLEDEESLLAYDAYDEFARAPYATVQAIKDKMDRPQLLKWITDSEVTINRKRLYYTMLGVCGKQEDLALLERLITSEDKRERAALDALTACYLTLAGEKGVKLIEDEFLRDKEAEYVDTYSAVAALRFHGTESDIIPVPRILEALRLLLERPDIADLVIPDLARWEDWTVIDRLVEMFKEADDDSKWVRVPIINYLRACPKPEAAKKIEELREVDPQSVRRALLFFDAGPSMDEEDADFDKQLDDLDKELDQELKKADGTESKPTEKPAGQGDGVPQLTLRPVVPSNTELPLAELPLDARDRLDGEQDRLDGDQALQADPYAQPISTVVVDADTQSTVTAEFNQLEDDQQPELVDGEAPQPAVQQATNVQPLPADGESTVPPAAIRTAGDANSDNRTASTRALSDASMSTVSSELPKSYTWWVIGIPVAINLILLVLAWSIFSGTFSRLFC